MPCGGVPCGLLCGCGPFSPCRCALRSPCGFRWPVGVRWCDPHGVRCLLRWCVLGCLVGVGRRWSPRRCGELRDGDYPQHHSPCFLVAKPGSTAKRLISDYGELNKKTLNQLWSIPNMESTLEKIASCRYKTKLDKRSGFWQVDLMSNAQELLAFITPQGRVFKWKVMPFGVANLPALFQELMNKILSILRRRPVVQELISRAAQMEAHLVDVCLGMNTQEDHLIRREASRGRSDVGFV